MNSTLLKQLFEALLFRHGAAVLQVETLWTELQQKYTHPFRHYHNLQHLQQMYDQLLPVKDIIKDWNTLLLALFYHDAVYNTLKHNNEEKSAALAGKRLSAAGVPADTVAACQALIRATQSHEENSDSDTNYFTDADLSILGQNWETYLAYTQNIRKEYAVYPDLIYKPGRKKVLQHFLSMPCIFKTEYFYNRYESVARKNLERESDGRS